MEITKEASMLNVKLLRASGLDAKWSRTSKGRPCMLVRNPNGRDHQRTKWWHVTQQMLDRAQVVGWVDAFDESTLLGDLFSVQR